MHTLSGHCQITKTVQDYQTENLYICWASRQPVMSTQEECVFWYRLQMFALHLFCDREKERGHVRTLTTRIAEHTAPGTKLSERPGGHIYFSPSLICHSSHARAIQHMDLSPQQYCAFLFKKGILSLGAWPINYNKAQPRNSHKREQVLRMVAFLTYIIILLSKKHHLAVQ